MTKIQPILKEDIEFVCLLAVECFADDPFYVKLSDDRNRRIEKMMDIFRQSIQICSDYGHAYGIKEEAEFVGFSIWFDYDNLKKYHEPEYRHIFYGGKKANEILAKTTKDIDSIINGSSEYLYLLALGVKSEFRQKGYASLLVNSMLKAYPHYNFFADVFNQSILGLYEKLGFDIIEGERDEYKFVINRSRQDSLLLDSRSGDQEDTVWLAIPSRLNIEALDITPLAEDKADINFVETASGTNPYFRTSLYTNSKARLIEISYKDLLKYQRYINVTYMLPTDRSFPELV